MFVTTIYIHSFTLHEFWTKGKDRGRYRVNNQHLRKIFASMYPEAYQSGPNEPLDYFSQYAVWKFAEGKRTGKLLLPVPAWLEGAEAPQVINLEEENE